MLLKQDTLEGIAKGSITLLFRRWTTPRVKAGSRFRTAAGVVAVDSVELASEAAITDLEARKAGYGSGAQLVSELSKYPDGQLYQIAVRLAGDDPRVALREDARLTAADVQALERKIAAMGARSKDGPWALRVLRLIGERPGVLAARLAKSLDMETALFKPRVRQLKELGLTESLEIGYRLSPRGQAFLQRLAEKGE